MGKAATKTPLSKRTEIVDFVAKTVQRGKASSWRYEISEDPIGYIDRLRGTILRPMVSAMDFTELRSRKT